MKLPKHKRAIILGLLVIVAFGFAGCGKREGAKKIDLSKRGEAMAPADQKAIRIAISAMISPKETFIYYKKLADYIGRKMNRPIEIVQRKAYAEVNELIENREIDLAFVCSGPYVEGKKNFGMELLVAPVVKANPVYYSYLIVHRDSPIKSLKGLKGKGFAFTDPDSNTGCLVPRYELAKIKETPDSFFSKYIFTNSHDNSIKAVAEGFIDGAAVDSLIWEYSQNTNPKLTGKTKIIERFGPFGIPPVVVHPDYDQKMKEDLRHILLNMDKDEEGRVILKNIGIDRFIVVNDSLYDSVRVMQAWIKKQ